MEINFITTIFFFLFLLATPCLFSSSKGGGFENGGMDSSSSSSSEVYEIDYRGPETHSSHISPPDHSHGRPWIIHHQLNQAKQPPLKPASNLPKASKVGA